MSSIEAQIEGLEFQISKAREFIKFRETIQRLVKYPEWKAVMENEYFTEEAARLVHQSADPALDLQQRADALNMAQASGHLRRWISMQIKMANTLEDGLVTQEETLEEMRAEATADAIDETEGE